MSIWSKLKRTWLVHFAKPTGESWIYRAVCEKPVKKWMEWGVGTGEASLKIIKLLQEQQPGVMIGYYGVDLFEDRPEDGPEGLSYKEAHKRLKASGARIQLIPGDPFQALQRSANAIRDLELLVVHADVFGSSTDQAWFYVPRMLAPHARVIIAEPESEQGYRYLDSAELQQRAGTQRRRAA